MCVNFTDLNYACPNDLYPLMYIDRLIEGSSGYQILSFIDAYLGYSKIQIDRLYTQKITFMLNQGNYYFNAMSSGLKNVCATY